ncbi:MAG: DUF2130 domain-containing protein, partial [Burkholderiaceae bacterium]|nr:DUF2130 domain-containing protein [Burkholderiaceae bacterium]
MNEVICPHCGKAFKIDEAGYADILKQVRDRDFEQQLHARLELAEQDKRAAIELARVSAAGEMQAATSAREAEIQDLKARLQAGEVAHRLAVAEALGPVEKARAALENELAQARLDRQAEARLAQAALAHAVQQASAAREAEIHALKAQLESSGITQQLAVSRAVGVIEKERDQLKGGLQRVALEKDLAERALREKYETQIRDRDDAIERLRDMK